MHHSLHRYRQASFTPSMIIQSLGTHLLLASDCRPFSLSGALLAISEEEASIEALQLGELRQEAMHESSDVCEHSFPPKPLRPVLKPGGRNDRRD